MNTQLWICSLWAAAALTLGATPSPLPLTPKDREHFLETLCETSPRLEGAEITVRLDDHVAILDGTARSIDQSDFASSLALAMQGLYGVINRIEVGPVRTDSEALAAEIRRRLRDSRALRAERVRVEVDAGRATLSGSVSTLDEREIARELASRVEGVRSIDDRVRIDFRHVRSDEAIRRQLQLRHQDDPLFDLLPVRVEVRAGEVRLSGRVGSRDELERLARTAWVTGVTAVDASGLAIHRDLAMPGMEDKDYHPSDSLKVVRLLLETDERIDASAVAAELRNGTLTLSGELPSPAARHAAERDARGVPGILGVRNLIEVRSPTLSKR